MQNKFFISALKWTADRDGVLLSALAAAKRKYEDGIIAVVSYTAISIKISALCAEAGVAVQMIAPDVEVISGDAITAVGNITITSTRKETYAKDLLNKNAFGIKGIIAFDDGDPIIFQAMSAKIPVWLPMSGKVV